MLSHGRVGGEGLVSTLPVIANLNRMTARSSNGHPGPVGAPVTAPLGQRDRLREEWLPLSVEEDPDLLVGTPWREAPGGRDRAHDPGVAVLGSPDLDLDLRWPGLSGMGIGAEQHPASDQSDDSGFAAEPHRKEDSRRQGCQATGEGTVSVSSSTSSAAPCGRLRSPIRKRATATPISATATESTIAWESP